MTTLSTVILSWENPVDTVACARSVIASINASGIDASRVVIVDNGSTAESVAQLSQQLDEMCDPRITLLRNDNNRGFSVGMNTGIRACRAAGKSQYYWLLNNDLEVDSGAVKALLAAARASPHTAIWGPTVISRKTGKVECAGGCKYLPSIGYFFQAYAGMQTDRLAQQAAPDIDYISGAAMFLRGDFLDRIDGLDESYFLYFEELELARQLGPGDKLGWSRDAIVYHAGGGSSVVPGVERIKTREATRSALRYSGRYHPYCLPTVFLARLFGILLRGIRQLDPGLPWAVLTGTGDYIADRCRGHS